MRYDRLTSIGLGIVALGWVVLVADMTVTEAMLRAGNLVAIISLRSDIVTIAQTGILTGFGLTLFGTLRSGFAALGNSLGAAPDRPEALSAPSFADIEIEPFDMGASTFTAVPTSSVTVQAPAAERSAPPSTQIRAVPAAYQASMERAAAPSAVKERNYVILPNGAVEVETLLGTRVFASLDEAKDFIR